MSEGPYKCRVVGLCSGEVVDERTGAVVSESNHKDDAYAIAHMMNKAHAHATDAAARRVRELEEALSWAAKLDSEHKDNCPVPDLGLRAMYRQKWREAYARAALAGKERSDGAE